MTHGAFNRKVHGFEQVGAGRSHIDEQSRGDRGKVRGFFLRHHHGGRGPHGQKHVGRDFLHDVVGHAVHERSRLFDMKKMRGDGFRIDGADCGKSLGHTKPDER